MSAPAFVLSGEGGGQLHVKENPSANLCLTYIDIHHSPAASGTQPEETQPMPVIGDMTSIPLCDMLEENSLEGTLHWSNKKNLYPGTLLGSCLFSRHLLTQLESLKKTYEHAVTSALLVVTRSY